MKYSEAVNYCFQFGWNDVFFLHRTTGEIRSLVDPFFMVTGRSKIFCGLDAFAVGQVMNIKEVMEWNGGITRKNKKIVL